MKATMKGDQALPLKAISKESLNRKDIGTRPPGTRFDDVLSGVADARRSTAKATTHRAAEPASRLLAGRSADAQRPQSGRDDDSIRTDKEVLPGPSAEHFLPQLQVAVTPVSADGSSLTSIDAMLADTGIRPIPPIHSKVTSGRQNEDGVDSRAAGLPERLTGTEVSNRFEPTDRKIFTDGLLDRPNDRPPAARLTVSEASVRPDTSSRQSIAFPAASNSELPRIAIVAAAVQAERGGPASGRTPPRAPAEPLAILGNEKHFKPVATDTPPQSTVAAATDVRIQPTIPAAASQRSLANRSAVQDSVQPADERRSPIASRTDPQILPTSSLASPVKQLAGAIAQEIGSPGSAPPTSAPDASSMVRHPLNREPLRILKVALEPAELGHVTVRMRLTGDTLELRVTAERAETASMLERDRHLLSRIIEASGYSAGDVTVQPATPSSQPGTITMRASTETQGDTQAAPQFQSNGSADGERQPSRPQDGSRHSRHEAKHDAPDIDPRRRGDLYV